MKTLVRGAEQSRASSGDLWPHMTLFRRFAELIGWCLALSSAFGVRSAEPGKPVADVDSRPPPELHQERIARGQAFLIGLFDPDLDLLPEFRGSGTYWLFHDNYLAARVLTGARPELSRRIREAMTRFGVTNSGKIEILFDEAPRPLPFRNYQLADVRVIGAKRIRTEMVTTNILKGWEEYADLLLFAAMALGAGGSTP